MTLKQIRELPRTLPAAHLYLDDIAEITQILLNAQSEELKRQETEFLKSFPDASETELAERRSRKEPKVRFTFADRKSGQTSADSIEDLESVGGSKTTFTVEVDRYTDVTISWFSEPRISLIGLAAIEQQRAVYQQIHSVFTNRGLRVTNAIKALPGWLRVGFWAALWVVIVPFAESGHVPKNWAFGFFAGALGLWFLMLYLYARPSRVFLIDSHERFKLRTIARQGHIRDLVFALTGGAIAFLVQFLLKKIR